MSSDEESSPSRLEQLVLRPRVILTFFGVFLLFLFARMILYLAGLAQPRTSWVILADLFSVLAIMFFALGVLLFFRYYLM